MDDRDRERAVARLRLALEMSDEGVAMLRLALARRFPGDADRVAEELRRRLQRPDAAPDGDAVGRVSDRFSAAPR